jgi:hypothetical protein
MKGQAAMEFLLTYGWAILIVIIMVSGLMYFGVLNTQMLLPDKCFFGAGIGCSDYLVKKEPVGLSGTFILINNFGNPIDVKGVNITNIEPGANCDCAAASCSIGGLWKPSETKTMEITCPNDATNVNLRVRITYKYLEGEYDRLVEGRIQSKVQQ